MPKQRKFKFKVSFTYTGDVEVVAENIDQAEKFLRDHFGTVLEGDIQSTLPDGVIEWDFPIHPVKKKATLIFLTNHILHHAATQQQGVRRRAR